MDLLSRYHLYLYALGYNIKSINDNSCSINDYVNAVKKIAEKENKTIDDLAKNIDYIFAQYDKGSEKYSEFENDKDRTRNGIKHF